jgi:hypothetical protein
MSRSKPKVDVAAGERTLIPFDEATRVALNPFEGDSAGRALVLLLDPEVTDSTSEADHGPAHRPRRPAGGPTSAPAAGAAEAAGQLHREGSSRRSI